MALVHQSIGRVQCTCGEWTTARGMTEGMDDVQGRHVAEVTEAAVRARVVADIRARIVAEPLLMYDADWRDGMETAADIARGADDEQEWRCGAVCQYCDSPHHRSVEPGDCRRFFA